LAAIYRFSGRIGLLDFNFDNILLFFWWNWTVASQFLVNLKHFRLIFGEIETLLINFNEIERLRVNFLINMNYLEFIFCSFGLLPLNFLGKL
jgi:hypothetical protein